MLPDERECRSVKASVLALSVFCVFVGLSKAFALLSNDTSTRLKRQPT